MQYGRRIGKKVYYVRRTTSNALRLTFHRALCITECSLYSVSLPSTFFKHQTRNNHIAECSSTGWFFHERAGKNNLSLGEIVIKINFVSPDQNSQNQSDRLFQAVQTTLWPILYTTIISRCMPDEKLFSNRRKFSLLQQSAFLVISRWFYNLHILL